MEIKIDKNSSLSQVLLYPYKHTQVPETYSQKHLDNRWTFPENLQQINFEKPHEDDLNQLSSTNVYSAIKIWTRVAFSRNSLNIFFEAVEVSFLA